MRGASLPSLLPRRFNPEKALAAAAAAASAPREGETEHEEQERMHALGWDWEGMSKAARESVRAGRPLPSRRFCTRSKGRQSFS